MLIDPELMARDPPGIMDGDDVRDLALFCRGHDRCRQALNTMKMDQRRADFVKKTPEDLGHATVYHHPLNVRVGPSSEGGNPDPVLGVRRGFVIPLPLMSGREHLDPKIVLVRCRKVPDIIVDNSGRSPYRLRRIKDVYNEDKRLRRRCRERRTF